MSKRSHLRFGKSCVLFLLSSMCKDGEGCLSFAQLLCINVSVCACVYAWRNGSICI